MRASDIDSWEECGTTFSSLSTSNWALVPLEAWRRRLKVKLGPNAHYTISDEYATYAFWQTRLTGVSGDRIAKPCDDMQATREVLHTAGVPARRGRLFHGELDKEEIRGYADGLGYPVCVKPNDGAEACSPRSRAPVSSRRLSTSWSTISDAGMSSWSSTSLAWLFASSSPAARR